MQASTLIKDICQNLRTAAKSVGNNDYTVVLRGNSTLRGYFPEELDVAVSILGVMDGWIICPSSCKEVVSQLMMCIMLLILISLSLQEILSLLTMLHLVINLQTCMRPSS